MFGSIKTVSRVEAAFQRSKLGPFVSETLTQATKGQGGPDMAKEEGALARCRTWKQSYSPGSVDTYTLTPISFAVLGDQTRAYRIDVTVKSAKFSLPAQTDFVLIRKGDVFIDLLQGGIGRANPKLLLTLAQTATRRLGLGSG